MRGQLLQQPAFFFEHLQGCRADFPRVASCSISCPARGRSIFDVVVFLRRIVIALFALFEGPVKTLGQRRGPEFKARGLFITLVVMQNVSDFGFNIGHAIEGGRSACRAA